MARRFGWDWAGGGVVFLLAMSHMIPSKSNAPSATFGLQSAWIQFVLSTLVVLWAGWPFSARLGVDRPPQSEHVHADCDRDRYGLSLQRRRHVAPLVDPQSFHLERGRAGVFRSGRCDHGFGSFGLGCWNCARTARPARSGRFARIGAEDRAAVAEDGREVDVPLEQVQVGTGYVCVPAKRVPVDGVILEGSTSIE